MNARGLVKEVASPANPIIKQIRSLSQKKNRDATGLFIAEGLKLVTDALAPLHQVPRGDQASLLHLQTRRLRAPGRRASA